MIDGIVFHDHRVLIVLGIDADGEKHVLGLREGTAENRQVAKALLPDLLKRGLDPERARLFGCSASMDRRCCAIRGSSDPSLFFGATRSTDRVEVRRPGRSPGGI
jgi:hypothetical protein